MRVGWTPEQQLAIESRGENLLVSAAAGSGKTAVLVERIMSLIKSGTGIDRMLVVTFSRAAAAEMKTRLAQRLGESAKDDPAMQAQLDKVERAQISTLHSFCADILRRHFEIAGVDPAFRVLDDAEQRQMASEALEDALSETYEQGGSGLEALDYGRGHARVGELALALYGFMTERPDPEAWLRRALIDLPEGDGQIWKDELLLEARAALKDASETLLYAADEAEELGAEAYRENLTAGAGRIAALSGLSYEELVALKPEAFKVDVGRFKPPREDPQIELLKERAERIRKIRDKAVKSACKAAASLPDPQLWPEDLKEDAPARRALYDLTLLYRDKFEERKQEKSVLTFNDLEHACLKALSDPGVVASVRGRIDCVFVDEYQDISDLQEAILNRVSPSSGRFMVGDVNQSIYRFRQAQPLLFLDKYARYRAHDGGRMIALNRNFRSRPAVLDFVNRVFGRVMCGERAEVQYDEDARLRPGAAFADPDPEPLVRIITREDAGEAPQPEDEDDESAEESPEEAEGNELEGVLAAQTVRELLGKPWTPPGSRVAQMLRPKDFAIIARSNKPLIAAERMLREAGIPAYTDASFGYLDALEVRMALSILRTVENGERDFPLLEAMRSPAGGFSTTDLARIRAAKPGRDAAFHDAVGACAEKDDDLGKRIRAFRARIARWRQLNGLVPLPVWLSRLLDESGLYLYAGGMPGGKLRQGNLDLLIHYAAVFDENQSGSLSGFLGYLQDLSERRDDLGTAHTLGEGDDVVRLMTVHKSKGLEFPVVIGVNMGANFRAKRDTVETALHSELGAGFLHYDPQRMSCRSTLPRQAIRARRAREDENEEMRILYVLMTRAKDRLILIGREAGREQAQEKYRMLKYCAAGRNSWLDAVCPAADRIEWIPADSLRTRAVPSAHADSLAQAVEKAKQADGGRLLEAMRWKYPYQDQALLPVKLTASGLQRETTGPREIPQPVSRPRFLNGEDPTAAERGTLIHAVLSGISLDAVREGMEKDPDGAVRDEIERLWEQGMIDARPDAAMIRDFFLRDIGKRMLASPEVRREWQFTLRLPAQEILGRGGDQPVLVQGVLDCCFLEDGQWILIDYKTDRESDAEKLMDRYLPQLGLYRRALESITGIPVREAFLCLLASRREIPLPAHPPV